MADTFDAGKFGAEFGFMYGVTNATWSASNVDLTTPSGAKYFCAPVAGSVVGLSVVSSAAVTAGTATFKAHKYSTEYAGSSPTCGLNETGATALASYATLRPGVITFSAGDTLGVSYTSDATFAPTDSIDFSAVLWVQLTPT
jgi:hypothetical protein